MDTLFICLTRSATLHRLRKLWTIENLETVNPDRKNKIHTLVNAEKDVFIDSFGEAAYNEAMKKWEQENEND